MRDHALFDKIDLHLIRVLHTVLTERSVSRAAVRLGMHQPAVSAALKRLRELSGDPLLVRSGASMMPTDRLTIRSTAFESSANEKMAAPVMLRTPATMVASRMEPRMGSICKPLVLVLRTTANRRLYRPRPAAVQDQATPWVANQLSALLQPSLASAALKLGR